MCRVNSYNANYRHSVDAIIIIIIIIIIKMGKVKLLSMTVLTIIQFNSCLFTCKLNSPEANCRVSTSKREKQQNNTNKIKTREYTY
jgi:hypothetical protein